MNTYYGNVVKVMTKEERIQMAKEIQVNKDLIEIKKEEIKSLEGRNSELERKLTLSVFSKDILLRTRTLLLVASFLGLCFSLYQVGFAFYSMIFLWNDEPAHSAIIWIVLMPVFLFIMVLTKDNFLGIQEKKSKKEKLKW